MMKLKLPSQIQKFDFYVTQLRKYEGLVEIKKIQRPRTIQQNKFLHVLITLFAIETGYTIEEAKTLLKRACDFMIYTKNDQIFLKRTRDLDTKELAEFITWIRNYAGMNGIFLPSPDDYKRDWAAIEQEIDDHKQYL